MQGTCIKRMRVVCAYGKLEDKGYTDTPKQLWWIWWLWKLVNSNEENLCLHALFIFCVGRPCLDCKNISISVLFFYFFFHEKLTPVYGWRTLLANYVHMVA